MTLPLQNLRVADFSWVIAGGATTKLLSDLGAVVVKVESIAKPDTLRVTAPYMDNIAGFNRSIHFAGYNAGKLSFGLNMTKPGSKEVASRLFGWADVVCENFFPGTMEKWGFSFEELLRLNDDIIVLSFPALGASGPMSQVHGMGNTILGFAGLNSVFGYADRDPLELPTAYSDYVTPGFAIASVMAALDRRRRTGQGSYIDMSQAEASMQFLAGSLMERAMSGVEPPRQGNRNPNAAPHGVYRCNGVNQHCAIAVMTEVQWTAFRGAIGDPSWASDSRFATLDGRLLQIDELDRRVEEWTCRHTPQEVTATMQAAGVPAAPVNDAKALVNDPHLKARRFHNRVSHEEVGSMVARRSPFLIRGEDLSPRRGAPLMGQDTAYVSTQFLGMKDEEWLALVDGGVLEAGTQT